MNETEKFKEGLAAVISAAKLSSNHITKAQAESCFKGITLNEEQWELIYSYLELNKIVIDDYEACGKYSELFEDLLEEAPRDLSEEDAKLYDMYLEDLAMVTELEAGEEAALVSRLLSGDVSVKNRLIEGRLHKVAEMAKRYCGKGVLISDLVQEGNMALMMAVNSYSGGDYDAWINSEVEEAFKVVVMDQEGYSSTGSHLASEANAIMETTARLAEELGREASLEELAAKMNLSEDAVRDIMKISMDALDMAEASGSGETFGKNEEISEEDRQYFEAAYEDGEAAGDGWRAVSSYDMPEFDEEEPDTSDFMSWLSEDEEDIEEGDYEDDGESALESGWGI